MFGPNKGVDWWTGFGESGVLRTLYPLNANVNGESTDSRMIKLKWIWLLEAIHILELSCD